MAVTDGEDTGDKPFEPTRKKLEDARKKGEVPHSADLTAAGGYGALVVGLAALGSASMLDAGAFLAAFLEHPETYSSVIVSGRFADTFREPLLELGRAVWPLFVLPAIGALLVCTAQRALVFAPQKLIPKLQRISPVSGAKNKFGRNGLFEFAKATVKLFILSAVLAAYLAFRAPQIVSSMALEPAGIAMLLGKLALEFLAIVLVLMAMLGVLDAVWQGAEHRRKHRMSRKELADETRESEGDPWIKGRRRDKGVEIATNRMLADVPGADVVIVNPTHFAIALAWDRGSGGAPVCVAKGVDEVAARIRETAMRSGVPVHSDPPTARALCASVEIGTEIAPEHYRAVALAIRFADGIRARRGSRHG